MPLNLFRKSALREWKIVLDDATPHINHIIDPKTFRPSPTFPCAAIRHATNAYLKRQRRMDDYTRDSHLVFLVYEYPHPIIAFAAIAHLLPEPKIRAFFARISLERLFNDAWKSAQLSLLIVVNFVNPPAVSELEAQWAQHLLRASTAPKTPEADLHIFESTLKLLLEKGVPVNSELHEQIDSFLHEACDAHKDRLLAMQNDRSWTEIRTDTTLLEKALDSLIDKYGQSIPHTGDGMSLDEWHLYAFWRTRKPKLDIWGKLDTCSTVSALRTAFNLQGPDVTGQRKGSLREGLLAYHQTSHPAFLYNGKIRIHLGFRSGEQSKWLIDRLMNAVDSAMRAGITELRLLKYLWHRLSLGYETIIILEPVCRTPDSLLNGFDPLEAFSAWQLLESLDQAESFNGSNALPQLLTALGNSKGDLLRDFVAKYLGRYFVQQFLELQKAVSDQLNLPDRQAWNGSEMRLHVFGTALKGASWWLGPALDSKIQGLLTAWPSLLDMKQLQMLAVEIVIINDLDLKPLCGLINEYYQHLVIIPTNFSKANQRMLKSLAFLWSKCRDKPRRKVAVSLANGADTEDGVRWRCLDQLLTLPDSFVHHLAGAFNDGKDNCNVLCVKLARLVASSSTDLPLSVFRAYLHNIIKESEESLAKYTSSHLDVHTWFRWIADLDQIFGDSTAALKMPKDDVVTEQWWHIRYWSNQLAEYMPALSKLEKALSDEARRVMACFFRCSQCKTSNTLLRILEILQDHLTETWQPLMQQVVSFITDDRKNVADVQLVLHYLPKISQAGRDSIEGMISLAQAKSINKIPSPIIHAWLRRKDIPQMDRQAMKTVAELLGITFPDEPDLKLLTAVHALEYIDTETAALTEEARRVDALRMTLAAAAPEESDKLFKTIGLESPSLVDESMSRLPLKLANVIEKVGPSEVEILFSLAELRPLRRAALGFGTEAKHMLLRVDLTNPGSPGFCMHLGNDMLASGHQDHTFCLYQVDGLAPDTSYCYGRTNRSIYQFSRVLWRHFCSSGGFSSLEDMHKAIEDTLLDPGSVCMVCGSKQFEQPQGLLYRSTVCSQVECRVKVSALSSEVRLGDLRQDPAVIDFLLCVVHAVCYGQKFKELLPDCPVSAAKMKSVLAALPSLVELSTLADMHGGLARLHTGAEYFLSWLAMSYRGFLISATGDLRIPSLPNTNQFLLANTSPELEADFNARIKPGVAPKILFHGTSIDRIWAILTQGLKILSGTNLQRHGTAYGNGIYLAEEPRTAIAYSAFAPGTTVRAGYTWPKSAIKNVKVLLVCEYVGDISAASTGIFVVPEPKDVMLRYIVLMPDAMVAPLANHVNSAIMSVCSSLRKGTL